MAADISDHLVAKIDERCRRLDQVDQAIAEMRRLQQEIAPLLRSPTAIEKRIMEICYPRRYSAPRSHFGRSFFIQARSLRTTLELPK